jgi:hypothetical protein
MNAIEVLESHEAGLEDLFHEISGAKDAATKRLIFDEIGDNLAMLTAMEANARRKVSADGSFAPTGHRVRLERIEDLLEQLRAGTTNETFDVKFAALQDEVEQEFDEVDCDLVPKLKNLLGPEGLWTLGAELIAIRRAFELRATHYPPATLRQAAAQAA